MKKLENGQLRDMTADEIAEHEQAQADAKAQDKAYDDAVQAKEDLKASAKAKLVAGTPLTEEEANTIVL
jgi:hypothetical protein